jgi:hypothetical protein
MIATVCGRFREFEGVLEAAEDLAGSHCYGTVKVASIDTGELNRDAHLRSPDCCGSARPVSSTATISGCAGSSGWRPAVSWSVTR